MSDLSMKNLHFFLLILSGVYAFLPILRIHTNTEQFYLGQDITLDLSATLFPNTSQVFYYWIQYGDDSQEFYSLSVESQPIFLHRYTQSGEKWINVTISNVPFVNGKNGYYSTLSNGYPAPIVYSMIHVTDQWVPYRYNVDKTNALIQVEESIIEPNATYSTFLSRAFNSLGEQPQLTLSNHTHSYTLNPLWNDTAAAWSIPLNLMTLNTTSPFKLKVYSRKQTSIGGIGISETLVDDSYSFLQQASFGYILYDSNKGGNFSLDQYTPKYFKLAQGVCHDSHSISILGVSEGSLMKDGMNGLILVSTDEFQSDGKLIDLTRGPNGKANESASLCQNLTAEKCSQLTIYSTLLTPKTLYVVTSVGVFQFVGGFTNVSWLKTDFSRVLISGYSNCVSQQNDIVFILYPLAQGGLRKQFSYLKGSNATWNHITQVTQLIEEKEELVQAVFEDTTETIILLVGTPSSCTDYCLYASAKIIQYSWSSGEMKVTFNFPSSFLASGMSLHLNGIGLYVYGTQLWMSVDQGNSFMALTSFAYGDSVVQFKSSRSNGMVAVKMKSGYLYYTRFNSFQVIQLKDIVPDSSVFASFNLNHLGELSLIHLLPSSLGYFTKKHTLKTSVRRFKIPLKSSIMMADSSFGSNLTPMFAAANSFKIWSSESNNTFMTNHVSMQLTLNSGKAHLVEPGRLSSFKYSQIFKEETMDASLTITDPSFQLDIQKIVSMESPPLNSVSLTLTNGTWTFADIGKTVIFNFGSILITGIASASVATGQVVYTPVSGGTVAPGDWKLYDFRGFINYATYIDQSLSVSNSNNLFTVTLTTGKFKFDQNSIGMILDTSLGWGYILKVESDFVATVTSPGSLNIGTVDAGKWQMYKRQYGISENTLPTMNERTRSWKLKAPPCQYYSANFSLAKDVIYMEYGSNISVYAKLDINLKDTNYLHRPLFLYTMTTNPNAFKWNITKEEHINHLSCRININAKDLGLGKSAILSTSPSDVSLQCAVTLPPLRIEAVCPPTRFLYYNTTYFKSSGIIRRISDQQLLPFNYRPPSHLGKNVPISPHVYRAAPEYPMYRNFFSISKMSGLYKQCLNATQSKDCRCEPFMSNSMDIQYSDCIQQAPVALYASKFYPSFMVYQYETGFKPLKKPYRLIELNGRTDYCVSSAPCNNQNATRNAYLNPDTDYITWKGSELYHFRVSGIQNEYCPLETQLLVYVVLPDANLGELAGSTSLAATAMCGLVFLAYILFVYRKSGV